jgi:hypothetical protein
MRIPENLNKTTGSLSVAPVFVYGILKPVKRGGLSTSKFFRDRRV